MVGRFFERLRERDPFVAWWVFILGGWFGAHAVLLALVAFLGGQGGREFLWYHFVGPWVAEASQVATATWQGVVADNTYSLVASMTYMATIVVGLVSVWYMYFRPAGIRTGKRFMLALVPIAVAGSLYRVLEDAMLFCRPGTLGPAGCDPSPFAYLMIAPFVYVGFFFLVILSIGVLAYKRPAGRRYQVRQVDTVLAVLAGVVFLGSVLLDGWFARTYPWTALLVVAGAPVYRWLRGRGWPHVEAGLIGLSVPFLLVPTAYALLWLVDPWTPGASAAGIVPWSVGSTVLVLGLLAGLAVWLGARYPVLEPLRDTLAATTIGGHVLEGFATFYAVCSGAGGVCSGAAFTGLEVAGYAEKHPVSEVVLGIGDGWLYPMIKTLAPGLLVLGLYWAVRNEDEPYEEMAPFLMIILVLGLVPAVRNIVRVMMGL